MSPRQDRGSGMWEVLRHLSSEDSPLLSSGDDQLIERELPQPIEKSAFAVVPPPPPTPDNKPAVGCIPKGSPTPQYVGKTASHSGRTRFGFSGLGLSV